MSEKKGKNLSLLFDGFSLLLRQFIRDNEEIEVLIGKRIEDLPDLAARVLRRLDYVMDIIPQAFNLLLLVFLILQ